MEAIAAFILLSGIMLQVQKIKNEKINQVKIDRLNNLKKIKKIQRARQICHRICYDEEALAEWKSIWSEEEDK